GAGRADDNVADLSPAVPIEHLPESVSVRWSGAYEGRQQLATGEWVPLAGLDGSLQERLQSFIDGRWPCDVGGPLLAEPYRVRHRNLPRRPLRHADQAAMWLYCGLYI